jgi:hypothetical protein
VQWLYRPEDLPGGRKTNHGRSELIVSNHMDIIEAFTVEDRAKVTHWNEDPDSDWPLKDQLFWRQFYDIGEPKAKQCSVRESILGLHASIQHQLLTVARVSENFASTRTHATPTSLS